MFFIEQIRSTIFGEKNKEIIGAPCSGRVYKLEKSKDPLFNQEILGKGCFIVPNDNTIYAPISGKVASVFPTKHAFGILAKDGTELLIHIGIDTVNLNGKYFESYIKQGDFVKKGDILAKVDFDSILKLNYSTDVYIVVTNINNQKIEVFEKYVNKLDCIFRIYQ